MSCSNIRTQLSRVHTIKKGYRELAELLASKQISIGEYIKQRSVLNREYIKAVSFLGLHDRERYQLSAKMRERLNLKRVGLFHEGFAVGTNWDGSCTHVNMRTSQTTLRYKSARDYCEGVAAVQYAEGIFSTVDYWRLINTNGSFINNEKYKWVQNFLGGVALVKNDFGYHFIKTDGTRLNEENYEDIGSWVDGVLDVKKDGTWIEISVPKMRELAPGLPEIKIEKVGNQYRYVLYPEGTPINGELYDNQFADQKFFCGLALVKKYGAYHYITMDGNKLDQEEYEVAHRFIAGLALVKKGGFFYFIKTDGTRLNDEEYTITLNHDSDMAVWTMQKKSGDVVFVDVNGKEFVERR